MFSVQTPTDAPAEDVWPLLSEPRRWSSWAPHIRGAVGLGSPEVRSGRIGFVLVAFIAPVPVRVTAKQRGRSWEWRTGLIRFRHAVTPREEGGSMIIFELRAPPGLEGVLRRTYGPVIGIVSRRLARVATEYQASDIGR